MRLFSPPGKVLRLKPLSIVLIYILFSIMWIVFSDNFVYQLHATPSMKAIISILKGWLFVTVTSILLFFLIKRSYHRLESANMESKHRADILAESENKFRSLFDAMSEGVALHRMIYDENHNAIDYVIEDVNPAFEKMIGVSAENARGKLASKLYNTSPAPFLEIYAKVAAGGGPMLFEPYVEGFGKHFSISVFSPRQDWFASVFLDISDRKAYQEELLIKDFAMQSSFSAICLADLTGKVFYVNPAFLNLWGYSSLDEIKGRQISEFAFSKEHISVIMHDLQAGKEFSGESAAVKKDGVLFYVQLSAGVVNTHEGRPVCIMLSFIDITERRLSEIRIQALSEKFRKAFFTSPDSININRMSDGMYLDINLGFTKIMGYTSDDIVGKTSYDINVWVNFADRDRLVNGLREQGIVENLEAEFRKKDGAIVTGLMSAAIIDVEDEKCIISITRDISERKNYEAAIRESEARFRLFYMNAPVAYHALDAQGRVVEVNSAWLEMLGYEADEVINNPMSRFLSTANRQSKFDEFMSDLMNSMMNSRDYEFIHKNGTPIYVSVNGRTSIDDKGRFVNAYCVLHNITARKKYEEDLRNSEMKYRSIIGTALDGFWALNRQGYIIEVNDEYCRIMGYSRDELLKMHASELEYIETSDMILEHIRQIEIKGSDRFETKHRAKNGSIIDFEASVTSGTNGIFAFFNDITEKKRTTSELILMKDQAEEASRLKSSFLANMSHELRTPMIGILGYSELLKDPPDMNTAKEYAEVISRSGKRLMETLNLILDLSRIEAGKLNLEWTNVDVVTVVKEVCKLFEENARDKNLFLTIETKFERMPVLLDTVMFHQIINNLINNAIKYTERGGVLVEIYSETVHHEGWVVIDVKDTGIGIAQEDQELIWDEFRQVSEGKGRSFEGTGLGLSITKKFVEKMNGKITLDSSLGTGSVFTIKFPFKPAVNISSTTSPGKTSSAILLGPSEDLTSLPSVLFVDDDPYAMNLVQLLLKKTCNLDGATNSRDAMKLLRQKQYDVILMDINLGKEPPDGIATTKEIRLISSYKNTPIIAVTAFAMDGDREEFLAAGCSHYLSKPFTKSQLLGLMQEVLQIPSRHS